MERRSVRRSCDSVMCHRIDLCVSVMASAPSSGQAARDGWHSCASTPTPKTRSALIATSPPGQATVTRVRIWIQSLVHSGPMQCPLRTVWISFFCCIVLSQRPADADSPSNRNAKDLQRSGRYMFYQNTATTPSPFWVQYQYERYGHRAHTLPVSAGNKDAAPFKDDGSVNSSIESNNTKMPQNGASERPEEEMQHDGNVEVTSRQHSNYNSQETPAPDGSAEETQPGNNGLEYPSIGGFLKFLKSLKEVWWKKSLFRIQDKIEFLAKLKDRLMGRIEKQFMMLWEDEERRHQLRQKRALLEESTFHFPPEVALISISFLTFAVFLIKLVLQVVSIVKSQHYSFNMFGVSGDAAVKSPPHN